jgi:hypothetical protein
LAISEFGSIGHTYHMEESVMRRKMIQPTKEIYKLALELACRNAGKNFQYNRDAGYYIQWAERIITEKEKKKTLET